MFRYKNKIIASSLAVLLVAVSLVSVSFSARVSKVSSSFACTTSVETKEDRTEVVAAVADIEVEALTSDITRSIEESLEDATESIYEARKEARAKAKAIAQVKEAQSKATVAVGANLNGLEAEILRLINGVRASHGLGALEAVQSLTDIARTRSSDMVQRGYFSHYSPEGTSFFNIMRSSGISWSNAGENLGDATPASYGSPSGFIDAWMGSPSHRDNMLRGHYRYAGVGVVDGGGRRVVTTIFLN